jgi:hypothetical protein
MVVVKMSTTIFTERDKMSFSVNPLQIFLKVRTLKRKETQKKRFLKILSGAGCARWGRKIFKKLCLFWLF